MAVPLGYYVLVRRHAENGEPAEQWQPDWSGILHDDPANAEADAEKARGNGPDDLWGYEAIVCAVVPLDG